MLKNCKLAKSLLENWTYFCLQHVYLILNELNWIFLNNIILKGDTPDFNELLLSPNIPNNAEVGSMGTHRKTLLLSTFTLDKNTLVVAWVCQNDSLLFHYQKLYPYLNTTEVQYLVTAIKYSMRYSTMRMINESLQSTSCRQCKKLQY